MGLFGGNWLKAVTRAVGLHDRSFVTKALQISLAPITLPTQVGFKFASSALASAAGHPSQGVQQIHENAPQSFEQGNQLQPAGPMYVYGGGGGDYSPYQGGYSPWDYSTPSITYSQPPLVTYPVYSTAPQQGGARTWEDLITAAGLFL